MQILYDFNHNYVPKEESLKFFSWDNLMFGKNVNTTPLFHYQMIDILFGKYPQKHRVNELSRGHAKTSVNVHKVPLYIATFGIFPNFGRVTNSILVSDTFTQADEQLDSMVSLYYGSDKLQQFLKLKQKKQGRVVWVNNHGHELCINARGAEQEIRGTNYGGQRPQIIWLDDIQSDSMLHNPDAITKLIKWFTGTLLMAVDISNYKVVATGTPMNELDLISSLGHNPEYIGFKVPCAEEFTLDKSKLNPAWKDRFTPDRIIELYNVAKGLGTEAEFFREMFLEMKNEETQIFKQEWLRKYDYKDIIKNRHNYNFFITMDLAIGQKQTNDRSVVMTLAVDANNNWFLVDCFAGRVLPDKIIEEFLRQVRAWQPIEARVESASLQQVFNHFLEDKMVKEKTFVRIQPLKYNTNTKKEYRIIGLQPKFRERQILFPHNKDQDNIMLLEREILGQTRELNTTGHDDLIDCLANFNDDGFIFSPTKEYSVDEYGSQYYYKPQPKKKYNIF